MSKPAFFTDEDVYAAVAVALRKAGLDAVSTPEANRLEGHRGHSMFGCWEVIRRYGERLSRCCVPNPVFQPGVCRLVSPRDNCPVADLRIPIP